MRDLTTYMTTQFTGSSFHFNEELSSIHNVPVFVFTDNGKDDEFYPVLILNGGAAASIIPGDNGSEHVLISAPLLDMDRNILLGVLAHEVGHCKLGHFNKKYEAYINKQECDDSNFEFEADDYAFGCGCGDALLSYLHTQNWDLRLNDRINALGVLLSQ